MRLQRCKKLIDPHHAVPPFSITRKVFDIDRYRKNAVVPKCTLVHHFSPLGFPIFPFPSPSIRSCSLDQVGLIAFSHHI